MIDRSRPFFQFLIHLELLLAETIPIHDPERVQPMFEVMLRALNRLRQRAGIASQSSYKVAIVGLTNVGKSTLFNALLGDDLAPRRNGPCTAAPIEFMHGPHLSATVFLQESFTRRRLRLSNVQELHRALANLANNPDMVQNQTIERIEVRLPHPLLASNLTLVDTPGFGAAQAGEAAGSHEEILREYLRQQVAQVIWIVRADVGIGKRELEFHDDWFADFCDDIVVTGSEGWELDDRQRFRQRFSSAFGMRMAPQFHFVSGLKGMDARRSGRAEDLEAAGIPLLENRIHELSHPQGRVQAIQLQLEQIVWDFSAWLRDYRDQRNRPLKVWWPEFSWYRLKQFVETEAIDSRPICDMLHRLDQSTDHVSMG